MLLQPGPHSGAVATVAEHVSPDPIRHNVGTCPACRYPLWADVWVKIHVDKPTLTADGKGAIHACATPHSMRLNHECNGMGGEEND